MKKNSELGAPRFSYLIQPFRAINVIKFICCPFGTHRHFMIDSIPGFILYYNNFFTIIHVIQNNPPETKYLNIYSKVVQPTE